MVMVVVVKGYLSAAGSRLQAGRQEGGIMLMLHPFSLKPVQACSIHCIKHPFMLHPLHQASVLLYYVRRVCNVDEWRQALHQSPAGK